MKSRLVVLSFFGLALAVAGPAHAPRLSSPPEAEDCAAPSASDPMGDPISRVLHEEANRKRCFEVKENQDLLAGKFGEWAAFRAAWAQHRPYDYGRLFGGWTPRMIFVGVVVLLFLISRRKR